MIWQRAELRGQAIQSDYKYTEEAFLKYSPASPPVKYWSVAGLLNPDAAANLYFLSLMIFLLNTNYHIAHLIYFIICCVSLASHKDVKNFCSIVTIIPAL